MNLNRNRIMDGARWRLPSRTIKVEVVKDGKTRVEERVEKLVGIRNILALNPAGVVIQLDLGNANSMAEDGRTPYFEQRLRAKMAKGFLPWHRCPVALIAAQEISPRALQDEELRYAEPCRGGTVEGPCPHIKQEQAHRIAKHNAKEAARNEAHKAEAERDREQRDRHHQEQLDAQRASADETAQALKVAIEALANQSKRRKGDAEG